MNSYRLLNVHDLPEELINSVLDNIVNATESGAIASMLRSSAYDIATYTMRERFGGKSLSVDEIAELIFRLDLYVHSKSVEFTKNLKIRIKSEYSARALKMGLI